MKQLSTNKRSQLKQQGLSLIELLIALTLGIFLVFGVIEVYVSSKQTYRSQDALSRLQENARFALDTLVSDTRRAGYAGCSLIDSVNITVANGSPTIAPYSAALSFYGYQNTGNKVWDPALPTELTIPLGGLILADDTDILTVQSAGACSTALTANMANTGDDITIDAGSCSFSADDVIMVSDCNNVDLVRINAPITGTTDISLPPTQGLSKAYTTNNFAEVLSVKSATYFIANDNGIPSLYVLDNNQNAPTATNPLALIEGVENMQIQYGIDDTDDGVPNQYKDAPTGTEWDNVVSARISLLMRTIEFNNGEAFTFDIGGTNEIYPAGPIRKLFETTVQLRNRNL